MNADNALPAIIIPPEGTAIRMFSNPAEPSTTIPPVPMYALFYAYELSAVPETMTPPLAVKRIAYTIVAEPPTITPPDAVRL